MRRPSIHQQTLLIAMLPMLLAIILLDSYFLYSRFSAMEAGMIDRAKLLAKQIASSGEYALFSGNTDQLQRDATGALKQKDVAVVAVQNISGKIIAYAGDTIQQAESRFIKAYAFTGVIQDTDDYFWVKEPIASVSIDLSDFDTQSESSGSKLLGYVLVKIDKLSLLKAKLEVLEASLLISVLLLVLTVFFVLRISRRIVNPIKALNQVVRNIGEGALDMRLTDSPKILELKELAQGVNEMAQQLQTDRVALDAQTELLRSNEERLNEIINTMPVALFIKDVHSQIVLMNSACEAQWGVVFSSVEGTNASRFFPPEQMAASFENDQQVLAAHRMVDFEEQVWNSEIKASRTLHTFKKGVYDRNGEPQYLIGISVDVSERKLAENRLTQLNEQLETRIEDATREARLKKEDAENANFDKTRFLAAASHDLRQPMHALGLFVSELRTMLTTAVQQQVAGKIEESVDALSNLLDALLDISKLDAGVVIPDFRVFSIASLLDRLGQNSLPLAEGKGITLKVISSATMVNSDPILLELILSNLLSNAIRYTPPNGRILLACRSRGDKLRVEVRDSGIGIPENEQQSIFREFVQLANKERDRSKGLGLGLAIVDRVAKLLNHNIELRSASDKGSVFSITLAKAVMHMQEATPQYVLTNEVETSSAPGKFDSLKVLVVDDDPLVRKGTQGVLVSWGGRVSMAESIREVKDIHCKSDFDLVICDYRLPDGDGIEMADWIKANFNTQPVFILISGDTSPEVLRMVNERGIQLLHKPVRPAKLRSLIQYLLNQKKAEPLI